MPSTDDQQQAQARKQSNLALAFKLAGLDAPRRRAMEIFYTFCRVADDIVDEPGKTDAEKRDALNAWRASIGGFFQDGAAAPHDVLAGELAAIVRTYNIPQEPLLEILDGCAMDIGQREYADAAALHEYCHGVACAVGLCSVRIFGCVSAHSDEFAVALGYALQFTNILRDVVEDCQELGRVYLPSDEMRACDVEADFFRKTGTPEKRGLAERRCDLAVEQRAGLLRLLDIQYFRAKHYFNKARRLVAPEDAAALRPAFIMGGFYEAILEKIKADGYRRWGARVRLSKWEKVRVLLRKDAGWAPAEKRQDAATTTATTATAAAAVPPRRVVVVGAGVAGISAAIEATLNGDTVTLLEGASAPGGRASSFFSAKANAEIDHGHHAMFGCYRAFLRLADILGVRQKLDETERLHIPYFSPVSVAAPAVPPRFSQLAADTPFARWLPAPLHLLAALLGFSELAWRDRLAVLRLGLKLKLRLGSAVPLRGETAAAWLARHGQTSGANRALWEPFCIAALNEPLATGDAALLHETLRRLLFGAHVRDSAVIRSRVPLAQLFMPEAAVFLKATGGELRTQSRVTKLETADFAAANDSSAVSAVVLADGSRISADAFILSVPWAEAARLLPATPSSAGTANAPALPDFATLSGRPILSVHLFTAQRYISGKLRGLLDSPIQWIFTESHAKEPRPCGDSFHYSVTLSCPGEWMKLSPAEIPERVQAELARFFPEPPVVLDSVVCKFPNATFAATPESAALRPGARTPWQNLFLAGDWTDTNLPATLEGAAQSGRTAAALITAPR